MGGEGLAGTARQRRKDSPSTGGESGSDDSSVRRHLQEIVGSAAGVLRLLPFAYPPTAEDVKAQLLGDDFETAALSLPEGTVDLVYLGSLVKKRRLWEEVLGPLLTQTVTMDDLPGSQPIATMEGILRQMLLGWVILFPPGGMPVGLPLEGLQQRSADEPTTEKEIVGPKEALVEDLETNIGLIRNRLRDPALRVHMHVVGMRSRTRIALLYLDEIASSDLVAQTQHGLDRQFNFGVTQIVLVSEELAREGVAPYLDYLWRKPEFSQLAQIIVVQGKASKMLEAGGPSGTAFRLYQYSLTARAAAAGSVPIPFWRFLSLSYAKVQDPWAPLLALEKGHFASVGTAVFRGDRMTGALGRSQTACLSWILHVAGFQDITTAVPGSGVPLSLHVQSTSVRQSIDQQGIAHLRLVLGTQVQEGYGVNLSTADLQSLEGAAAQTALSDVQSAIQGMQAASSDVVGFGERLRERSPQATENWSASFARMPVAVEVTVHLRTGGRAA